MKNKTMNDSHTSLRSRLIVLISTVILVMLVLEILTGIFWFRNRYQQETGSNIDIADAVRLSFEGFVRDLLNEEFAIGSARQFGEIKQNELAQYLKSISNLYYTVRIFSIVDSTGTVIASSRPQSTGIRVNDRDYFKSLKEGDSTVVSNFIRTKSENIAGFVVGRGFFSLSGALEFAVLAVVQADRLGEVTLSYKTGKGEYFTLFDRQGTLIYTNELLEIPTDERRSWKSSDQLLQKALQGETATGFFSAPIGNNKQRIGARVPIDELGWVAGAAITQGIFLKPLVISVVFSLLVLFVVAGITLLYSERTVRTISRSLGAVQNHVRKISRGEYSTIKASSGFSEFDSLTDDANSMAEQLRERENALRHSEERFRGAVNGLLDAFIIMSPIRKKNGDLADFRIEYANQVALDLAQAERDEFVGRRVSEIFPPETQKEVLPIYDQVLRTRQPTAIDAYRVIAPRGAYIRGSVYRYQGL